MIPTNGRIGICAVCECEQEMTIDHIVPKWLLIDVARFGLSFTDILEKANLQGKMWRDVCTACNVAKGGQILWKDPVVRDYMKEFVFQINERLNYQTGPRKLKVVCGCGRKEPCSTVLGIIEDVIKTHEKGKLDHTCWKHKKCWCKQSTGDIPTSSTASPQNA